MTQLEEMFPQLKPKVLQTKPAPAPAPAPVTMPATMQPVA
jgi:hypothetical protein